MLIFICLIYPYSALLMAANLSAKQRWLGQKGIIDTGVYHTWSEISITYIIVLLFFQYNEQNIDPNRDWIESFLKRKVPMLNFSFYIKKT